MNDKERIAETFKFHGMVDFEIEKMLTNDKNTKVLYDLVTNSCNMKTDDHKLRFSLLLLLATTCKLERHREYIVKYISDGKFTTPKQVDAAVTFFKPRREDAEVNSEEFEKATGVGVVITNSEIEEAIMKVLMDRKEKLQIERHLLNVGEYISAVQKIGQLKWADNKVIKEILENHINSIIGPITKEEEEVLHDPKKKKDLLKKREEEYQKTLSSKTFVEVSTKTAKVNGVSSNDNNNNDNNNKQQPRDGQALKFEAVDMSTLTESKNNNQGQEIKGENSTESSSGQRTFHYRIIEDAKNPEDIMKKELAITGGRIYTRFPPEPNGYLHIGHAKAMNLSFTYAQQMGGLTYLRYDDTNPEVEETVYYNSIKEMVEWMGFKPFKITHTSDYFQEMYELAVKLIKLGLAYCDPSPPKDIEEQREKKQDSPYRNRPIEENLKLFEEMKQGKFEEGKMALRVKYYNQYLRDFICYRVKYHPHAKTGTKWCIYPSYDFSHCIVDSLEHITHSLCTLEFEVRRDSYFWLLAVLGLYRPLVWEFSRLNMTKTMMSKRKLLKMVQSKVVHGWDDPRMMTLAGLRRRGYTPEAIKSFCNDIGVNRNESLISLERLEQSCRLELDESANRIFAVLHPLKVTITNIEEGKELEVDAPNHPKLTERGTRKLPLGRIIFIERNDFREVDSKDYHGLAPNKFVGLRFAYPIKCTEVKKDLEGKVLELMAVMDFEKKEKPKGFIHWLSCGGQSVDSIVKAEVRLYKSIFTDENPGAHDAWEKLVDPTSEEILHGCLVDPILKKERNIFSHYQFERLGFFVIDPDTTQNRLVFNRTVTLKESFIKFSQ